MKWKIKWIAAVPLNSIKPKSPLTVATRPTSRLAMPMVQYHLVFVAMRTGCHFDSTDIHTPRFSAAKSKYVGTIHPSPILLSTFRSYIAIYCRNSTGDARQLRLSSMET